MFSCFFCCYTVGKKENTMKPIKSKHAKLQVAKNITVECVCVVTLQVTTNIKVKPTK